MEMLNKLTSWTDTTYGKAVVGASVLVLGLTHFGWASNVMDMGVGPVSVGMVAGSVGVLVGATCLANMLL